MRLKNRPCKAIRACRSGFALRVLLTLALISSTVEGLSKLLLFRLGVAGTAILPRFYFIMLKSLVKNVPKSRVPLTKSIKSRDFKGYTC